MTDTITQDRFHVATAISKLRGEGVRAVGEINRDRQQPSPTTLTVTLAAMEEMIGCEILGCSAPESDYLKGGIIERAELHEAGFQNGALLLIFNQDARQDEARDATVFEPGDSCFSNGSFTIELDSGRIVEVAVDNSTKRSETYNECGVDQLATAPSVKLKLIG